MMNKELQIAELGALRAELNSVIDRKNTNENFVAGVISAVFAFSLTNPPSAIHILLPIISLGAAMLGWRRYYELRTQVEKLDSYLVCLEEKLDQNGGWTKHYYTTLGQSATGGYSITRNIFWSMLTLISLINLAYVSHELSRLPNSIPEPQPASHATASSCSSNSNARI